MASGAGASAGAGAARIDKWDQDIERSIPIFSPGDLRKQFIGAFDRVVGADDGKIEPEFLYKPDAAIAMGRLLENPGRRREIDRWRLEDVSNSGERGLPFFGYKAATGTQGSTRALVAPTKYVALISRPDGQGNTWAEARIIDGRYEFRKQTAYKTLDVDQAEELLGKKKAARRRFLLAGQEGDNDEADAATKVLFGKAANRVKSRASDSDSDSSGEDSDGAGAGKVSRGYRAAMGKKPKSNRRGTGLSDSESDGSAEGWGEGGADMGGFGLNRSDDEDVSVEGAEESASSSEDEENAGPLMDDDEAKRAEARAASSVAKPSAPTATPDKPDVTDDIAFVQRMAKVGSAKEPAKAAPAPHLSAARVAEKRSRTSVAEEEKLAARAELVKQLVGHGGELTSKQVSKLYKSKLFPKYPTVSQQVFKTVLKAVADAERRGGKTLMRLKNSEWKKIREGKAAHKKQRVA